MLEPKNVHFHYLKISKIDGVKYACLLRHKDMHKKLKMYKSNPFGTLEVEPLYCILRAILYVL